MYHPIDYLIITKGEKIMNKSSRYCLNQVLKLKITHDEIF